MVRWTKNRVYDTAHKSVTGACIAFTLVGSAWLGYKFVSYMMYTRPIRMEEMRQLKESNLAAAQLEKQQKLQAEAETIRS